MLVVSCWLFVVGCWLLVVGCWLLMMVSQVNQGELSYIIVSTSAFKQQLAPTLDAFITNNK
ncbi:MAG TPA: hypothetical protein DDZ80_29555 [Cyanobacteria bacterium UBA8803]|nr:hypothetical protein [Cyanobacteria bacterium UBA8803]